MRQHNKWLGFCLATTASLLLAGCGGGGSGGGGDGSSDARSVSLTLTTQQIAFDGYATNSQLSSTPGTIAATISNGSGKYYGNVVTDSPAVAASFASTGNTSGNITPFLIPSLLTNASGAGHLTVEVCEDAGCTNIVTSQTINYTYSITGFTTNAVDIQGVVNGGPVTTSVTLTGSLPPDAVVSSEYPGGFLSATLSGNTVTVVSNPAGLPPGGYFNQVQIQSSLGILATLNVNFTVNASQPYAPQTVTLNASTTASALSFSVPVTFSPGAVSANYTATSSSSWLIVNGTNYAAGQPVLFSIDPLALLQLGNWCTQLGEVTLTSPGLATQTIAVTVAVQLPEVYLIASGPSPSGQPRTVTVAGRGFSQLSTSQLQVANAPGAAATIVSDVSATFPLPALGAGAYAVSAGNLLGLPTATADVIVADAVQKPYGAYALAGPIARGAVSYDPYLNAVLSISGNALEIDAIAGNSVNTTTFNASAYGVSGKAATYYLANSGLGIEFNVLTNNVVETLPFYYSQPPLMPVTADHRLWTGYTSYVDLTTLKGSQFSSPFFIPNDSGFNTDVQASGDGALLVSSAYAADPGTVQQYSATTQQLSEPSGAINGSITAISQNHQVVLIGAHVYHTGAAAYTLAGTVPTEIGFSSAISVLAADGSRIYVFEVASGIVDHVSVYNIVGATGGALVRLGTIAVTDQASQCALMQLNCLMPGAAVIDPFGMNLYWVGSTHLVVLPIAAGLRPVGLANNRQRSSVH